METDGGKVSAFVVYLAPSGKPPLEAKGTNV